MTAPAGVDPKERERLRDALRAGPMAAQLRRSFRASGRSGSDGAACHILDARYEPGGRSTVLYELDDHLVLGILGDGDGGGPTPDGDAGKPAPASALITRLGMRIHLFPHDPLLPGLTTATNPDAMKRVLGRTLPMGRTAEAHIVACRPELLRYRPMRRCTLRLHVGLRRRSGAIERRALYAKLYHDGSKAASVYEDLRLLSASPPLRAAGVVVTSPVAFVPELDMILLDPLAGTPLAGLLEGRDGPDGRGLSGVVAAAGALAELHSAGHAPARRRPAAPAVEKMRRRAAAVGLVDARLRRRMEDLADALASCIESLDDWGAELETVHGDCKPSQFLISASHVAMLDFDHCGLADPAADVGDFRAALRKMSVQRRLSAAAGRTSGRQGDRLRTLEESFVEAYLARRPANPSFHRRVSFYQGAGLLRKAYRAFQRSPSSPLPAALVSEAWTCLERDSLAPAPQAPASAPALQPVGGASR